VAADSFELGGRSASRARGSARPNDVSLVAPGGALSREGASFYSDHAVGVGELGSIPPDALERVA
jgi:hypothetical protein